MNVILRGHNWKISDSNKEYIQKKIDKLDRYLPNISEIRVDLSRQKNSRGANQTVVQITLRHKRGAILRAEERVIGDSNEEIQAAVNGAVDKMYRQITRFKGKRESRRRKERQRFMATIEELEMAETIPEVEEAASADDVEEEIVRRKMVALSPMTEQEAIEQMELLGHDFFMFYNAETDGISVLYRRQNGGYGVLVPQNA